MTMKMGLWGLSLLTVSCAIVVSCGGSSDDGEGGPAGGTSSASGSGTGGSAGSATAGTSTGGTTSSGGSGGSGTSGSASGGTPPGGGGDGPDFPGGGGDGPDFPGAGGDGPTTMCPATEPMNGDACTLPGAIDCEYADVTCNCRRMGGGQQGNRAWDCGEDGPGGEGGGPGFGEAECPENAQDEDACTGTGLCPGQQCFCADGEVNCFGG